MAEDNKNKDTFDFLAKERRDDSGRCDICNDKC